MLFYLFRYMEERFGEILKNYLSESFSEITDWHSFPLVFK